MSYVYTCRCSTCTLARGPAKLDVVDAARISPYRIITGTAVPTSTPTQLNGWAIDTIRLGNDSPADNIAVLPDSICGDTPEYYLHGSVSFPSFAAGRESGIVFEYIDSDNYAVAGIRLVSATENVAFLRLHPSGTEYTRPIFASASNVHIWRRGDYVFTMFDQNSSSATYLGTTKYRTRSGIQAYKPHGGRWWLPGCYAYRSGIGKVNAAYRHNIGLLPSDQHFSCNALTSVAAVANPTTYPRDVGGSLDVQFGDQSATIVHKHNGNVSAWSASTRQIFRVSAPTAAPFFIHQFTQWNVLISGRNVTIRRDFAQIGVPGGTADPPDKNVFDMPLSIVSPPGQTFTATLASDRMLGVQTFSVPVSRYAATYAVGEVEFAPAMTLNVVVDES